MRKGFVTADNRAYSNSIHASAFFCAGVLDLSAWATKPVKSHNS